MKRNTKNPIVRNIISVTLICIVCILFLSFLLQTNTPYNFKQEIINSPIKELQSSASNSPKQQWYTTWGGSSDDSGSDIALDSSNNVYVGGITASFGAGMFDMALVKYNNMGEQQWNTTWGGSSDDSGRGIAVDSSDNIYLVGSTTSFGAGMFDMALVKYNSLGEQQWNTTWGGSDFDLGSGIAVDSSDNIYLVGSTGSPPDMVIVKYNSLGEQQWNTTWGGSGGDLGYGIAVDSSDNIYLVGSTTSFGAGHYDMFLVKYNSLGEQQWNTTWGGVNFDLGYSIALDMSNNIYITGGANSIFFYPSTEINFDVALVKYNSLGEQQWNTTWGGSGDDSGRAIVINSPNNIYLLGRTTSFSAGNQDMVFVKYSSSGEQQWNTTWGGSEDDYANEIEIDSSNNIYITGGSNSSSAGDSDIVLIKYSYLGLDSPILNITTASPTTNLDINLAWTTSPGADNYTLYRHTSQITSSNLNSVTEVKTITGTSTTDTVPVPGRWYYAIVTNNEAGSSDPSNSPYIDVQEPSSEVIPGYNLFLLFGVIGLISAIIIKKRCKTTIYYGKI